MILIAIEAGRPHRIGRRTDYLASLIESYAYKLGEMRSILSVLRGRPQMAMLLSFLGLRPSEWVALRWEDIDLAQGILHVRRSGWMGQTFDGWKGKRSVRDVTLGPAALGALESFRQQWPSRSGYVVESARGLMVNPRELAKEIRRVLESNGIRWASYYGARRATSTHRQNIAGGNSQHVAQELGHSIAVANEFYVKPLRDEERENALAYDSLLSAGLHPQGLLVGKNTCETIRDDS